MIKKQLPDLDTDFELSEAELASADWNMSPVVHESAANVAISVRIPVELLLWLKSEGRKNGLKYQTFLKSVITKAKYESELLNADRPSLRDAIENLSNELQSLKLDVDSVKKNKSA